MKIQLIKIPRKIKYVVLSVLLQFMFSNVLLASGGNKFSVVKISQYIQQITVSGTITSAEDKLPVPGVTIMVKGNIKIGVISDSDGKYKINLPSSNATLVFSSVGFKTIEKQVNGQSLINVVMTGDQTTLNEVVVIGYGKQKKETLIGSVSQVKGEILRSTGGVSSLGSALTGRLPGLITTASSGMPGAENPLIYIRGQNSWNGTQPLILVDGVERPEFFNQMDIGSVESISVLKDASATAVFGSRGANGVIVVTTKRGLDGKAEVTATASSTMKTVSKLPGKYDSYDAIGVRNQAIERELSVNPGIWAQIIPQAIRDKYRFPTSLEEAERYPNVDWQEVLFKDFAMSYNANVSVRGGTDKVKYFASIDYQNEKDLFNSINNGRGYEPGFDFNRLNFRSNLDFKLTSSTLFQVDLGGTYGVRKTPWDLGNSTSYWSSAYSNPPDAFLPVYSDGIYGYPATSSAGTNSYRTLAVSGIEYLTTATLMSNFILEQNFDQWVKGLKFRGSLSVDNQFSETKRGVLDANNDAQQKYINPYTGLTMLYRPYDTNTRFDYYAPVRWQTQAGALGGAYRKLFYQLKLDYNTIIADDHNFGVMGLMSRQESALGSTIPSYREDWVFRTTYSYKGKYLLDYNGAYNGSEKFAPENRFAFFSSGGLGWVVTKENFMQSVKFLDLLKLRASYGEVGDDSAGARFLFQDQWSYGGTSQLGVVGEAGQQSPYTWYNQTSVGNPAVRWETVKKYNGGFEYSFFKGLFRGEVDVFRNDRSDILMTSGRAVPSYYGTAAPAANLGSVRTNGYEIQFGFYHTFKNGLKASADFAITRAIDKVINRDDAELLPDYQQQAGFQLGQYRTYVSEGFYNSWDQLYGSTAYNTDNQTKVPGNYNLLDMNADGVIDSFDITPYEYSNVPQNTYNANLSAEWRGLSLKVQFYGVNNVTRDISLRSLSNQNNLVYEEGSYWTQDNINADSPLPRWSPTVSYFMGSRYLYDGSYVRLKNAELAYNFLPKHANSLGLAALRIFLNGNNLFLWSKMPDDRESNTGTSGSGGAYPMTRRFNLGLNITF